MCSLNLIILVSLVTVSDVSGAADHLATNLPFLSFLFQIEYWRDGMVVGTTRAAREASNGRPKLFECHAKRQLF